MISKINSRGMEKSGRKRRIAKKKKKKVLHQANYPCGQLKISLAGNL